MIAMITFDHTVKLGGVFHPPGKPIKVVDPEPYLSRGATLVSFVGDSGNEEEQPGEVHKRVRRKKNI